MILKLSKFESIVRGYPQVDDSDAAFTKGKDLQALCALAIISQAKCILEIGTAYGHTAVALAKACPEAEVYTLDTCKEMATEWRSQFKAEILSKEQQGSYIRKQPEELQARIHAQVGPVHLGRSLVTMLPMPRFDFAFIDGDHRWRSVVCDTEAVLKRIAAGGLVVWDDYATATELRRFLKIVNERSGGDIVIIPGLRICYFKVTEGQRNRLLSAMEGL